MTSFTLASNQFSGTTPSELGRLTMVGSGGSYGDDNFLNYNQITGTCPTQLGRMTSFSEYFEMRQIAFTVGCLLDRLL